MLPKILLGTTASYSEKSYRGVSAALVFQLKGKSVYLSTQFVHLGLQPFSFFSLIFQLSF